MPGPVLRSHRQPRGCAIPYTGVSMAAPSSSNAPVVRFGVFELDLRSGELRKAGTRISIQEQPLQALALLLERPGEPVTRDELRRRLWPSDTFVDYEHGLNAVINRLRDTLGDSADTPRLIETLPRRGYRFIGSVDRPDARVVDSPAESVPVSPAGRRWRNMALWGTLILAGAGGTWLAARHGHGDTPLPPMKVRPLVTVPGMKEPLRSLPTARVSRLLGGRSGPIPVSSSSWSTTSPCKS